MRVVAKLRLMPRHRPAMRSAAPALLCVLLSVLAASCRSPAAVAPPPPSTATVTTVATVATPELSTAIPAPSATPYPTNTPAPSPTAVVPPTGLEDTLILYATAVDMRASPNRPPGVSTLDDTYAFKTWPPLPFVDPAVFDVFYGERIRMDSIGMFFHDFRPKPSPDGRYVLVSGLTAYPEHDITGTGTWLLDLAAGEARQLLPDGEIASWSPTSDAITYVDGDTLYTLGIEAGATPRPIFQHDRLWSLYAHWSPDGRWIATVSSEPRQTAEQYEGELLLTTWLVPSNGEPARALTVQEDLAMEYVSAEMAWSPDGQYLLMRNKVFDLAGNRVSPDWPGRAYWLPSDARLLVAGEEGVRIMSVTGEVLALVSDEPTPEWAFSRDGRRLAYSMGESEQSGTLNIYDLESGANFTVGLWGGASIRWSAGDDYLIVNASENERPKIVAVRAEPNGAAQTLVEDGYLAEVVVYSPVAPAAPAALLFARDDDLYRADAGGGRIERLTEGGLLGWGMAAGDAWWVNAPALTPRVSPDGRRVAFSPDGDTVVVVDVDNPAALLTLDGSAVLAWSPNSDRLAVAMHAGEAQRAQLAVYDLATGEATLLLSEPVSDIAALVWSPDGQRIAFGCCFVDDHDAAGAYLGTATGQVYVADLASGPVEQAGGLSRSVAGGIEAFCWTADNQLTGDEAGPVDGEHCSTPPDAARSPDGQRRFSVTGPPQPVADSVYQLVVEELATGETWQRALEGGLWPIAWSPDSQYILLDDSGAASPIWRIPVSGAGAVEVLIEDGRLLPGTVQPAPTSAWLTYHSDGHLYRVPLDGRESVRLTTEPLIGASDPEAIAAMVGYRPPVVSPDGRLLALNGNWGGAAALDLTTGEFIGIGRGRALLTPSWSPDSRQLAYVTQDDQLCIYNLNDEPAECLFTRAGLMEAVWSPAGSLMAAAVVTPPVEGSSNCCDGQIWLVDATTGEADDVTAFRVGFEYVPGEVFQWLPDGSGLVIKRTGADDGAAIVGLDGSLTPFDEWIADVAPDGRTVLHASGALSSVDGTPLAPLPGAADCAEFLAVAHAWSPDSRLAYTLHCGFDEPAAGSRVLTIVDPTTGAVEWQRELPDGLFPVAWSPDGQFILLDDAAPASPLWRLAADGTGEPEIVVEDGYWLGVVPVWE